MPDRLCYRVGMSTRCSLRTSGALRLRWITAAAAVSLGLSVAITLGPVSAAASPSPSGPVDVLSAGSLQDLLQQQVGPAFQAGHGIHAQRHLHGVGCDRQRHQGRHAPR